MRPGVKETDLRPPLSGLRGVMFHQLACPCLGEREATEDFKSRTEEFPDEGKKEKAYHFRVQMYSSELECHSDLDWKLRFGV